MIKEVGSISIIGSGNVAFHLGTGFFEQGLKIDKIYSRNKRKAEDLAKKWNCEVAETLGSIDSEFVIVCVNDSSISSVVKELSPNCKIAYTSGATDLSQFDSNPKIGVIYPLQTFSRERPINLFEVPFLIEAKTPELAQDFFDLTWKISRKVIYATSKERAYYHLSAVWVNNFTNHLMHHSKIFLEQKSLNWELLKPLMNETVEKLNQLDPYDAQTGPARRNDNSTIENHLNSLEGIQKEIYTLITKSIQETYRQNDKL